MTADPEPDKLLTFQKSERSVADGHATGVDRLGVMDFLELEAWMPGILAK
jgi:hypothetical protein